MKLYILVIFISKSHFNDFQQFTSTSKQAETSIKQLKKIQWVKLIVHIKKIISNIVRWRRSAVGSRLHWPLVGPRAATRLCWHKLQLSLFDQSVCTCQELSGPGCGTSSCHRALLRLFWPKHPWAKTRKALESLVHWQDGRPGSFSFTALYSFFSSSFFSKMGSRVSIDDRGFWKPAFLFSLPCWAKALKLAGYGMTQWLLKEIAD